MKDTERDCGGNCGNPRPSARRNDKKKNDCAREGVIYEWLIEVWSDGGVGDDQQQKNRQRNLRWMPKIQAGTGSVNGQLDSECSVLGIKYIVRTDARQIGAARTTKAAAPARNQTT